jgi:hypothetical protein
MELDTRCFGVSLLCFLAPGGIPLRFCALFGPKTSRFCLRAPALLVSPAPCFLRSNFCAPNPFELVRPYIYQGEEGQIKKARTRKSEHGRQEPDSRKQDRHNRTVTTEQSQQDRQNRTGRTGQAEQERQNRAFSTGHPEWGQAEQEKQNGTGRPEQVEQERRTG